MNRAEQRAEAARQRKRGKRKNRYTITIVDSSLGESVRAQILRQVVDIPGNATNIHIDASAATDADGQEAHRVLQEHGARDV